MIGYTNHAEKHNNYEHPWQLQEFTKKKITQYKSIGVELVTTNLSSELNQSCEELIIRLFGKQRIDHERQCWLGITLLFPWIQHCTFSNFFEPYRIDHLPHLCNWLWGAIFSEVLKLAGMEDYTLETKSIFHTQYVIIIIMVLQTVYMECPIQSHCSMSPS